MTTAENDSVETSWHLRVLNRCDGVLTGLSEVMKSLRKQRKVKNSDPVSLRIFQESLNQGNGLGELPDRN